jgi:hypothetical protein
MHTFGAYVVHGLCAAVKCGWARRQSRTARHLGTRAGERTYSTAAAVLAESEHFVRLDVEGAREKRAKLRISPDLHHDRGKRSWGSWGSHHWAVGVT